ncbi:MAG: hypothetical protein KC657_03935 [Myxococcales bacterium]|nr:hypothetical protein [Myxococcales bacterium]
MARYEYRILQADVAELGEVLEARLNALGAEGWRLTGTVARERHGYSHEVHLFLSRRAADDEATGD